MIPIDFGLMSLTLVVLAYLSYSIYFVRQNKPAGLAVGMMALLLLVGMLSFAAGTHYSAYWSEPTPKLYIIADEYIKGDTVVLMAVPLDNLTVWDEGISGRPQYQTAIFYDLPKASQTADLKTGSIVFFDGNIKPYGMILKNYYVEMARQEYKRGYGTGFDEGLSKIEILKNVSRN